jgi:hypothetical protein
MKRKEIIHSLLKEGFTEKFLSKLTDRQITDLSERVLSEATFEVSAEKIDTIKGKVGPDDVVKVSEEETNEESSPKQQAAIAISKKEKKKEGEINEWVEGLVKTNYHPEVTTKKEIYEMIGSLSDSADNLVDAKNMFSVDEQSPSPSKPDTDAPVREKPTTKPNKPSRENPFQPKHQPKPKAKLPKSLEFKTLMSLNERRS